MALPGFELLYSSVAGSLKSTDDAAIAVLHWNLITNGLKCCGIGESWTEDSNDQAGGQSCSELLPESWNEDSSVYCLRYKDPSSDSKYLMKAVAMDGSLILHLIRCFDEKTVSTNIRSRDFVNDQFASYKSAFTNLGELNTQLTDELHTKIMDNKSSSSSRKKTSSTSPSSSSNQRQPGTGRSSLLEDNRRDTGPYGGIPHRGPFLPGRLDPFGVGRADLDPLAAGQGGGMFMDPSSFPGSRGIGPAGPYMPGPPGFPPGSVPPGARFDPIGPPGVRPNPDPDHERPPDNYDDMFM